MKRLEVSDARYPVLRVTNPTHKGILHNPIPVWGYRKWDPGAGDGISPDTGRRFLIPSFGSLVLSHIQHQSASRIIFMPSTCITIVDCFIADSIAIWRVAVKKKSIGNSSSESSSEQSFRTVAGNGNYCSHC